MKFEQYNGDLPKKTAGKTQGNEKIKSESVESNENVERNKPLGIDFFVTDHNLLYTERSSIEYQRELYAEMKRHGLDSIRFDIWWKELSPEQGDSHKEEVIDRYAGAMRMMHEAGLKDPTLVISNPPAWAQKRYDSGDKEGYFRAYREYIDTVAEIIRRADTEVHSIQMFNEINHTFLFKYVAPEDLPRLAEIIRTTIGKIQPDIKLSTSFVVGNMNDTIATIKDPTQTETPGLQGFLTKHESMLKETFDILSLDYYPGVWHMPLFEANLSLKDTYKQLGLLKETCERIAGWKKEYEIGEVGFPTNAPYNSEKRQRYFYDTFFRAFRQMIVDFRSRGVTLPSRVGLYETEDEANISFGGTFEKLLKIPIIEKISKLAANPEHDFGLKKASGKPKMILTGRRHNRSVKENEEVVKSSENDPSQLANIIRYVNRPIE